jgi:hypothetical protein
MDRGYHVMAVSMRLTLGGTASNLDISQLNCEIQMGGQPACM